MTRPTSLLQVIIAGAAERLANHPDIPRENRDAFRATAVHIFEQQVCAVVGTDTLRVTGWATPPTERWNRRERIEQSLLAGESVKTIAMRELVSPRWVRRIRAALTVGGTDAP